jgi:hypothetical protein
MMSRFANALSGAADRLTVPEPARSRILLELAADMEDLHQAYLDRGYSDEDAHRETLEQFDLSEETLRELASVHDSPLQRSLETLSGQVRGTGSRVLLGVLALTVAVSVGPLLLQGELYRDASGLVWLLLPLLLVGLGIGFWKGYLLFFSAPPWAPELKRGLGYLLSLSLLQMALAFAGLWVELYRAAVQIRGAPREAIVFLVGWIHSSAATLIVALAGAIILGSLWFFLVVRSQQLEESAAARLLEVTP